MLKMLGLYLYTLVISHKSCKMYKLYKLTLQKDLHNFVTNNVFMDKIKNKIKNTTTTKQKYQT